MLIVVVVVVSAVNNKISLARSRVTNFEIGRRAALSMQNVYHLNRESSPLHVLVCIRYRYTNSVFFGNHYRRVISTSINAFGTIDLRMNISIKTFLMLQNRSITTDNITHMMNMNTLFMNALKVDAIYFFLLYYGNVIFILWWLRIATDVWTMYLHTRQSERKEGLILDNWRMEKPHQPY